MIKRRAKKPVMEKRVYVKYGFVRMREQVCLCPSCMHTVNAGPNYQPKYCDQCGQRLTFEGVEWEKDEELGYVERREASEPVENRVV